ncbi:MAG TPA: ice-binding family protein, partial [Chroococcales cyanobacterium]
KNDLSLAFNDAFGRSGATSIPGGHLSGKTLFPGVYKAETSALDLAANGTLTLDADSCGSNAVWIFQAQTDVVANALSRVILSNGAKASNVFWVVGNSATINASSIFQGTIMAQNSIAMGSGANLQGRALAMVGSVTLDTNIVTRPTP